MTFDQIVEDAWAHALLRDESTGAAEDETGESVDAGSTAESEDRAQQLGERAAEGTAGEALDQLEGTEDRQDRIRKGKADGIIESTSKSNQRVRHRLERIDSLEDALNEFN